MFEIRVELPNVSSASELNSHLAMHDEDCTLEVGDGAPGVLVRSNGTFPALLRHIRDWVELTGTEPLTVHVDGMPHTLEG